VLLAGLYPAWNAARTGVAPGLHASSLHGRHGMVRRALILVQVTLAVVLLFGASLFSHSLRNLKTIDLGYRVDQLLSVQLGMKGTLKANSGVMASPELRELVDRVRHLPGVEAAALSQPGLLSGGMLRTSFTLTDGAGKGRVIDSSDYALATTGFFGTISLPILRGRDFSDADGPGAPPVAIVNQRFARTAWPGEEAIGKHLDGYQLTGVEVVGVIADSRDHDIHDAADPTLYLAYNQQKSISAALELRCRSAMAPVEAAVRDIVKTAAPDYQVARSSSLELMRDSQISQDRLLAFLSNLFGVLGATLALVGIYGLIAYSVMRRTREIGIRISVGAQRHDVLWLFLREASLLLTGGLLIGLPVGLALTHFVAKLLYHVPALDAVSAAVTAALIVAGGVMASWIPARRATRVDPASALRSE
jgi:predicted permease